ncbi:MAG TPA: DUF2599 domain-containing protein [Plantibacter sp.]|uniref:DUF2599 domain-containing protein n=1 Tax=unclassified Plantibacter TaxID=2624265 RepID=UPI002C0AE116|nr:DUF2599 domain-containing protein [Plantibacter sp.]
MNLMTRSVATGGILALIACSAPAAASAAEPQETTNILQAISDATSDSTASLEKPLADRAPQNKVADSSVVNGVEIEVPARSADLLRLDASIGGEISVQLPFPDEASAATEIGDGLSAYDNGNGSHTVPIVKSDGAVQITAVIENKSAPVAYNYDFVLPEGGRIEPLENGAAILLDANDAFLGGVAPAWAKDANGGEVATHFEVEGSSLIQVVEHDASTPYPVIADPYLGVQMVQGVYWEKRDPRGLTLSVIPTAGGRAFGGAYLAGVGGWPEVEGRVGNQSVQMEWQYICHHQFAFLKETYNLDTWVTRNSYADSVANGCN